ncbi:hypothetical protein [Kribbella sp. NPDC050459]|jgi:hypothetical protein|uniref:hypothetical protein n=1 Tax=Kribbella sp. NPDC050459 TaxID=3155785 RepID=UPI002F99E908
MGAAIALPLLTIALISLVLALWTLYAVGVEAVSFAKFTRRHGSGETAAHYEPGDHEHVSTKPPEGYGKS